MSVKNNKNTKKRVKSVSKEESKESYFIIRFNHSLVKDIRYETPMYWNNSDNDWVNDHFSGTIYSKENCISKIGELLHESKIISELVDVTTSFKSPVKIGTIVIEDKNLKGISKIVVRGPEIEGEVLTLVYATNTAGAQYEYMNLDEFIVDIRELRLMVIWDGKRSFAPSRRSNIDYLKSIDCYKK